MSSWKQKYASTSVAYTTTNKTNLPRPHETRPLHRPPLRSLRSKLLLRPPPPPRREEMGREPGGRASPRRFLRVHGAAGLERDVGGVCVRCGGEWGGDWAVVDGARGGWGGVLCCGTGGDSVWGWDGGACGGERALYGVEEFVLVKVC